MKKSELRNIIRKIIKEQNDPNPFSQYTADSGPDGGCWGQAFVHFMFQGECGGGPSFDNFSNLGGSISGIGELGQLTWDQACGNAELPPTPNWPANSWFATPEDLIDAQYINNPQYNGASVCACHAAICGPGGVITNLQSTGPIGKPDAMNPQGPGKFPGKGKPMNKTRVQRNKIKR